MVEVKLSEMVELIGANLTQCRLCTHQHDGNTGSPHVTGFWRSHYLNFHIERYLRLLNGFPLFEPTEPAPEPANVQKRSLMDRIAQRLSAHAREY